MELTQKIVKELLEYDSVTGILTWKRRARKWFIDGRQCHTWNTRYAGQTVGHLHSTGYWYTRILYKLYKCHRVAWLYMTGKWPKGQIDHINQNREDNRFNNLRIASKQENSRNSGLKNTNTSGQTGVSFSKSKQMWIAYVKVNRKQIYLGAFHKKKDAIAKRLTAEKEHDWFRHNTIGDTNEKATVNNSHGARVLNTC